MSVRRYLIVKQDDFGQSPGGNRGIIEAHEHGIVTSTSLMVRWPAAAEAVEYVRKRPGFSLGLHIDLGEWVYRDENWTPLYQVVPLDDVAAGEEGIFRPPAALRELAGREPTPNDFPPNLDLLGAAR